MAHTPCRGVEDLFPIWYVEDLLFVETICMNKLLGNRGFFTKLRKLLEIDCLKLLLFLLPNSLSKLV